MSRYGVSLAILLLAFSGRPACYAQGAAKTEKEAKPLLETWQAAYFEGLKVGHVHILAREMTKDGKTYIHYVRKINLGIKRYGSILPIRSEEVCDETADGKVLGLSVKQYLAGDRILTMTAVVKDGEATVSNSINNHVRKVSWNDDVLGLYAQELYWQKRKVKPGDRARFYSYELFLPALISIRTTAGDFETVDRLVPKKDGKATQFVPETAKLLRVQAVADKIMIGETPVQLPPKTMWLDGKGMSVRERYDLPGVGAIISYRTTKAAALEEGVAPTLLPDMGLKITIPLKQTIDRPYATTEAVYRVTLKEDLVKVFAEDVRQEVRDKKDKSFELIVKAVRAPGKTKDAVKPGKEYTESNQFIDSDDTRIRAVAARVVGEETDPWRKVQKLEKWVHANMKVNTAVGFPAAGHICRNLEGDCRQHAVLLAALCRAVGVPSRTAVGMIYARVEGRSPVFAFHMWTEVWIDGWLGLDAVLGQGGIGATHLKMGDHSWSQTVTLAPLLPVTQALGKIHIDVVRTK